MREEMAEGEINSPLRANALREVKVYLSPSLYEGMLRQLQECGCTQSGYVRRLIAQDVLTSARVRQHTTDVAT